MMGKYHALGFSLFFTAFTLWMVAIYMPRDFVDISEYANNFIWLGNGVGLAWIIWLYVYMVHKLKKHFRVIGEDE
jgi:hypothetical protein